MNVRFKINDSEYRIKSGALDLHLELVGTKKEGKRAGEETFIHIGHHGNVFEALKTIPNHQGLISECTTLEEAAQLYINTLKELKIIMKSFELTK